MMIAFFVFIVIMVVATPIRWAIVERPKLNAARAAAAQNTNQNNTNL